MPNISQSKDNQTIKFGKLIEYNKKNIFLKNHAENEAGGVIPDKKKPKLYEVKVSGLHQYLLIALNLACNKDKLSKT